MNILGIGGILNDPACTILSGGRLAAAVEERKIARSLVAGALPKQAINACLQITRTRPDAIDCVAVARPIGAEPETKLHLELRAMFPKSRLTVVDHHTAHAASAFFLSPFQAASVLVLDRSGDFCCGTRWLGQGNQLTVERELYYPDSLGDLYGRVTELLGFRASSEEHKVQWLSTYGDTRYEALFEQILGMDQDGWPHMDRSYLDSDRLSRGEFSSRFYEALGLADVSAVPEGLRAHLAAGVQGALEKALPIMAGTQENICFAGGLGMNALLVAALERKSATFVQPAAGNAGTALGAALYAWHTVYRETARVALEDLYLGPQYSAEEIKRVLENCKLHFRYLLTTEELLDCAVRELSGNKIIAWMQGRMEFGPRALGNRSILASPLDPYSTENLNEFIKHREPFRKFAASVPAELAGEYFDAGPNARFLATVARVKPRYRKTFESAILGHDYVRVHTVSERENPLYHRLLREAGKATGLPVLYNTSFNLFGDPLVCSPRDAARSFFSSGIDVMFVGNFLLEK